MSESGDGARAFTAGIERRFRWYRSLVRPPRPGVGALALRSVSHARVVGRPLSLRSAVGAPSPVGVQSRDRPVRPRGHPFLRLWRLSEGEVPATDPPALVAAIAAHAGRLPRSTSPQQTPFAPGGGLTRLQREVLPVRLVPEVAAVGPVVSDRERRRSRAVPRPPGSHGRYRVPGVMAPASVSPEERGAPADGTTTIPATPEQGTAREASTASRELGSTSSTRSRGQERPTHRRRGDPAAPMEPDPASATSRHGGSQPEPPVAGSGSSGSGAGGDPDGGPGRAGLEERGRISDQWGASPSGDPALSAAGWGAVALLVSALGDQETYVALARRGSELVGERGPFWQYTAKFPRTTFRRGPERVREAPPGRQLRRLRARTQWRRLMEGTAGALEAPEVPRSGAGTAGPHGIAGAAPSSPPGDASASRGYAARRPPPGERVAGAEGGGAGGTGWTNVWTHGRRVGRRDSRGVEPRWGPASKLQASPVDGSLESEGEATTAHRGVAGRRGVWSTVVSRGRRRAVLERGIDTLPGAVTAHGLFGTGVVPLAFGWVSLHEGHTPWPSLAGPMGTRLPGRSRLAGRRLALRDGRGYLVGQGGVGGRRSPFAESAGQQMHAERQRDPGEAVRPLPASLEPLASALGVQGPVEVQSGPRTRQSLRAVGTVAATVGRRILVAHPEDRSADALGIIAHELVHVAAGDTSRGPRLFDDPRLDDEERRARRVGSLVRALVGSDAASESDRARSLTAMPPPPRGIRTQVPELHGSGTGPLATAPPPPLGTSSRSDEHDGVLAELRALYARSAASPVLRDGAAVVPTVSVAPGFPVRQEHTRDGFSQGVDAGGGRLIDDVGTVQSSSAPRAEEFLDWLVEQVERRLARELDARGLRHRPDVL